MHPMDINTHRMRQVKSTQLGLTADDASIKVPLGTQSILRPLELLAYVIEGASLVAHGLHSYNTNATPHGYVRPTLKR